MIFPTGSRREEQRIRGLIREAVAESKAPQTADHNLVATRIRECSDECTRCRIVSINPPVSKVADEQCVTQFAKVRRCLRESPRRIEIPLRHKPLHKVAI